MRRAKLHALIQSRWEVAGLAPPSGIGAPGPAALGRISPAGQPATTGQPALAGWVMVNPALPGALGGALTWGLRQGTTELHVIADDSSSLGASDPTPGVLARRASWFCHPAQVWTVDGRELRPAGPAAFPPASALAAPGQEEIADLLRAHGIDPVMEHGVLIGEVLGLEVARVVGGSLAIGVGHHDREARAEMRPGQPIGAGLDEVVALVRQWRAPGAERHPANVLARERWLRSLVMGRPDLVGARWLDPVAPLLPRGDLRRAVPAAAVGDGVDGRPVVAVCSVGVDLDVVPVAADHQAAAGGGARLAIVVPEGDDVRATTGLAAALAEPAEVVTVPRDWTAALAG